MKIILERHAYAPGLNKAYIGPSHIMVPAPGCTTIAAVRKALFAPLKYTGRHVVLRAVNVPEYAGCDNALSGFCNDLRSLSRAVRVFKARHNLPGCRHIVKTRLIG